jgi:hypothetical protein
MRLRSRMIDLAAGCGEADIRQLRLTLLESAPRILSAFPEAVAVSATSQLRALGVDTGARVVAADAEGPPSGLAARRQAGAAIPLPRPQRTGRAQRLRRLRHAGPFRVLQGWLIKGRFAQSSHAAATSSRCTGHAAPRCYGWPNGLTQCNAISALAEEGGAGRFRRAVRRGAQGVSNRFGSWSTQTSSPPRWRSRDRTGPVQAMDRVSAAHSLGALIIALGLLVDDAMIAVEMNMS